MSKDGLTQVEYALMLGRLGYRVIPLCWPSSKGYCACGWNHKVDEVGKAPRVLKGVKAARSKATKITRLWDDLPRNSASTPLPPKYPASGAFPMGGTGDGGGVVAGPDGSPNLGPSVLLRQHRIQLGTTDGIFSIGAIGQRLSARQRGT